MASRICRHYDWAERLKRLVWEKREVPFEWGQHDCSLWAGDILEAMTGKNFTDEYRGKYMDPKGAKRLLAQVDGVKYASEIIDRELGDRVHPSQLVKGDIVATTASNKLFGPTLGLCYGRKSLFAGVEEGQDGLVTEETLSQLYGWKIWPKSSKVLSRQ